VHALDVLLEMKTFAAALAIFLLSIILSCAGEKSSAELNRKIEAFMSENDVRIAAVMFQNPASLRANKDASTDKPKPSGFQIGPMKVPFIAESRVTGRIVDLYTSIEKLPRCARTVKILYTHSTDEPESFLGYTIENPDGVYTKLVIYDGKLPWLEWIIGSFESDDAEQNGAGQPATVPKSKPEGDENPKLESEGRSR